MRVTRERLEKLRRAAQIGVDLGAQTMEIAPIDLLAIVLDLERRIATAANIFETAQARIEDYDRREAAGEDVSHEIRPRMPGGSDF